jgi:glycerophosphoryl diester phosphodiesterase
MPLSRHADERNMQKFQILAHRGLVSEFVPENTLKAFADALHVGADVLETDVQCTADGVAIIFHDEDLLRMAGIPKKVSDVTWREISVLDIGHGKRIPSLKQALQDFPFARFNLDVKVAAAVKPTASVINELKANSRVLISSFSDRRRKETISMIDGPIRTSAGSIRVLALWLCAKIGAAPLFRIFSREINALQIPVSKFPIRLDKPRFISFAKQAGLELHYWTVNDIDEVRRLKESGANGIVTDNCDLVIASLKN